MKKYIYGTILVAVLVGVAVFFFRPPSAVEHSSKTVLELTFRLPEGFDWTPEAPFSMTWSCEDLAGGLSDAVREKNFNPLVSPYKLIFSPKPGSTAVALNAHLYYCDKTTKMCFQDKFKTRVPLVAGSPSPLSYVWEIIPKQITD
jgi:hypothetical protein